MSCFCCVFSCVFFFFFTYFSCRICLRLLFILLSHCLRDPCECVFCCFVALVCFPVDDRYIGEFMLSFVWSCVCLVSFCLFISHVNLLIFVIVVAHTCLFHARSHTLVSIHTLSHEFPIVSYHHPLPSILSFVHPTCTTICPSITIKIDIFIPYVVIY